VTRVRTLDVPVLTRVEGEGALHVRVREGDVQSVALSIYEPPRFFEGLLRGRSALEAPDITARICGICPVAYQMSACNAVEQAWGVQVSEPVRLLRRLLYCGEWIESHALHIYLLHAPDLLGYPDALTLAADDPGLVQRGLRLKKAGNALMALVGGRAVHPINVRVGGFYRFPTPAEVAPVRALLDEALDDAEQTVRTVAALPLPPLQMAYHFVALDPGREHDYPLEAGPALLSGDGTATPDRFPLEEFDERVVEVHVEHSNALHARLHGVGAYLVGPLARWALLGDRMTGRAAALAAELAVPRPVHNPFASIVVRALEVVYAVEQAQHLLDDWPAHPGPACAPVRPRAGLGRGASEAPRGVLVHRYRTDEAGDIRDARIVPPTSQNQAQIEADLWQVVEQNLHLDDATLTHRCETAVRNHDPCISCATHALRVTLDRA
jgi:coenzyme F420-reducing hydrogenase alpha subunit